MLRIAFATIIMSSIISACSTRQNDYFIASYYFPNYHVDARNAKIFGDGWMEWELVKAAKPRFPGHNQPNVPAWGYTDEANPDHYGYGSPHYALLWPRRKSRRNCLPHPFRHKPAGQEGRNLISMVPWLQPG